MELILASQSPRRKRLLSAMGIEFVVKPSNIQEVFDGVYPPHLPIVNAILKAEDIASQFPEHLVLGSDTLLEFEGGVLGKPNNMDDAVNMLHSLSGKTHLVTTGVCLRNLSLNIKNVFSETSIVKFKTLTDEIIVEYFSKINPLDKAGSYAIQKESDMIIEDIKGSVDNVMGLPCAKVKEALIACGLKKELFLNE